MVGSGLVAAVYRVANFSSAVIASFSKFSDEEGGRCEGGLQGAEGGVAAPYCRSESLTAPWPDGK
jgi:hypothetical protein